MSMRESRGKKVSFNMQDDLEQKIDKLMVMMGKLVTEDDGCSKPFRPQIYISPVEVEIKIEETFMAGLETMHTGDAHHIIKIVEVDREVILIIGEVMGIILEVVRDTGKIIMITEGIIIEVKVMIEIGVYH